MPHFESPLGSKKISGQPALKEFDVPDESGYSDPPQQQTKFAPPVTRQFGAPIDENSLREFQARMDQMEPGSQVAETEREIRMAREAKRTGKERLNEGARRRIDMLLDITRGIRTVEIEGQTYVLKTLKAKEMRSALATASEFDGTIHSPFEIRKQLLARSISQVAGVDVDQFVGSTALEARFDLLDEMDEALLNRLYNEYLELAKEARDRYTVKTPQEAQEVVDDLKK